MSFIIIIFIASVTHNYCTPHTRTFIIFDSVELLCVYCIPYLIKKKKISEKLRNFYFCGGR